MVLVAGTAILAGFLLAITVIDLRSLRIPDLLSLPLIALGLVFGLVSPQGSFHDHLIGAVAGFASLGLIGTWYFRRYGADGLGLGDAKLFAAAGAWLGWQALPMVLLVAAGGGLAYALITGRTQRQATIAFGPWLALGMWLVWLWQGAGNLFG
jgi:leader peptidase (prepilin peptidase) / N-methyltransferase